MISEKMQKDAQARLDSRMLRITRNNRRRDGQVLALPAPEVEGVIANSDGLLLAEKLKESLKVKVPIWITDGISGDTDQVILFLKDTGGTVRYTSTTDYALPLDPTNFPATIEIPHANIPADGVYLLQYTVVLWNANSVDSDTFQIIIDSQPPYYDPGNPATPAAIELPVTFVTDDYLTANGDVLVCKLPQYSDKAEGDQIIVYLGLEIPGDISNVVPVVGPIPVPDDLNISIPGGDIRSREDGTNWIIYWLKDKAGNFSDISEPVSIDVQLGPLPLGLQPPVVPLGNLITRASALEIVTVEIPAFTGADKVTIKAFWGGTALSEIKPGASPQFPLVIQVPWSTLKAEYDFDGVAEQPLTASYQAWRGTLSFPEAGPLTADVNVDLSVVGPENPDPDPVNPALPAVHLTSFTDQTDKLTAADNGQPATAKTLLHASPVKDEIIELYWRDTVVANYTVDAEVEGDEVSFVIAWDDLLAGGNDPQFPMTYTISGPEANNYQRSSTTYVEVDVVTIALDAPTFPTKDPARPVINCSSLDCGTRALQVNIPGNSTHLKDGDQLTLNTAGYDSSDILVPGTEFSLPHTLLPGQAAGGVTLRIDPYDTYIAPIVTGRIKASYTVTIAGQSIRSAEVNERLSVSTADGGTCPVVPC